MRTLIATIAMLVAFPAIVSAQQTKVVTTSCGTFIVQDGPTQGPQWWSSTTNPGVEMYGVRYPNGVVPEAYRLKDDATTLLATGLVTGLPAQGDAYGFTSWLNSVRAQYGLPAVGYDANLEAWANMNNAQQNARGIGHFVMGPARRQNSAMGHYASIGAMWLSSPAHRAALLDPTIRTIGIAGLGAYWTFNAY